MNPIKGIAKEAAKAASPNYLGNPEVVEGILRTFGGEYVHRLKDGEEIPQWVEGELKRLIDIFAGRNEDYPGPTDWNEEGGVDEWIRSQMPSPDWPKTLDGVLRTVLVMFLDDLVETIKAEADGMDPKAVQENCQGIVETFRNLLVGIPIIEE